MTRNLYRVLHSRSRIVRNQEWDPALAQLHALDLAKLVFGLLGLDAVHGEATLGVVDETEVLAGLLDCDHVHVAGRVGRVGADLAVDLDEALHQDGLGLASVEGVLETRSMNVSLVARNVNRLRLTNRLRMKTIRGRQSLSL
jgi:hypothetical protein